jgi:FlaA1/EpsC-like NDP-sugar epimerase
MQKICEEWEPFLGRPPITTDAAVVQAAVSGKRILITGAGGCIGSALAKTCAQLPIESLILLDNSENGIFELDCDLAETRCPAPRAAIAGDVCDSSLLEEVFQLHRPHIVFHAAAWKHVPLMEKNPFTAARTNIIGTHRLVNAALRHAVEQFILLSTDKAVAPVSIMGATKRIAELTTLAGPGSTQRKAVRLANVLGSSGSVVPLFLRQIASGSPVTVTHPDAARYFLTLHEAVQLLLSAASSPHDSAILVADPGTPRRILDLAEFLIRKHRRAGSPEVPVVFTALRPGDKLEEQMTSAQESFTGDAENSLRKISSPSISPATLQDVLQQISQAVETRSLEGLLNAVCIAVPEYRPGAWLYSQAELSCGSRR